eukprot:CAMPEP_0170570194 /NCGR_PEP_ID=MMETSP0224-20130122/976_1 /TAXON_ID=285029 /ORGANISM="Togula jolla, Strain CCCM 725" /LENGTH=96 /DNA_ID=CAMNT_0010892447 /DNA_START=386 /DNA_END=677 /DNA_ORIENTATION=+
MTQGFPAAAHPAHAPSGSQARAHLDMTVPLPKDPVPELADIPKKEATYSRPSSVHLGRSGSWQHLMTCQGAGPSSGGHRQASESMLPAQTAPLQAL